jgi:hypothetical protein
MNAKQRPGDVHYPDALMAQARAHLAAAKALASGGNTTISSEFVEAADDIRTATVVHYGHNSDASAGAVLLPNAERPADEKRTRKKKIPRSERVWKAINAVNDYYRRVAGKSAPRQSREAIIAAEFGVSPDHRDAKNLARQLREYEHLIQTSTDD